ncbi:ATP-binding protein [Thiohalobacter sp. IOR34]|uniref:sensor histidine kinase n=1 Tax=Thiohalobacter sp. IOR34 TaxID=3057176 RepID=UPI0025AEF99D|nr:ATP-binding protein [Thiohalobacter sp. IOR34]WJW75625.1 ATP-binding protein [Thiohalobacter sp. IOR34]
MATRTLRHLGHGLGPMLLLFGLLLVSLSFMSDATHNSERFGRLYSLLLLTNAIGLMVLAVLISSNLYWLVVQYRKRAAGARLTARLVAMFVILAVLPVSVVYYFSLQFLNRGIDSWFDVQIERSLEDALELSRSAFDVRLRDLLHKTQALAEDLTEVPSPLAPMSLFDLRVRSGARELTLLGANGRIIASSSVESTDIVPDRPSDAVLAQLRQGQPYVALDPAGEEGLQVRVVVPVPAARPTAEQRVLQALYDIPERLSSKAESVEQAYVRYKELAYLRKPLKQSYTLTLSVVLLLSLLSAVWGAFFSARRLVAPIRDLAEGTRAVADGDYSKQLSVVGSDELGFLVQSFNVMTRRLALARDEARRSQQQVEGQRAYLEALLGNLSSGVISLSPELELRTVNEAACEILGVPLAQEAGATFQALVERHPFLEPLGRMIERHQREGRRHWTEEITLFGRRGRQVLICRAARLPGDAGHPGGQVIVFDDVTALIQAQRDAAWGEVARRLAHEIKNPLTPIQLSAERLRRKYLPRMEASEGEVLDRATHTIVQQVEAMKEMVNAFSEYARAPQMQLEALHLNRLVEEVLELYRGGQPQVAIRTRLDTADPRIEADANRIRQLLHNLIKNAREAAVQQGDGLVEVETRVVSEQGVAYVDLSVRDNGPGFREDMVDTLFEPYVTSKPKGTGLGLAIVKKIVEEHGGVIHATNGVEGGAVVHVRLRLLGGGDD